MAKSAQPQKLPSGKYRIRWFDHEHRRCSSVFATLQEATAALEARRTESRRIRAGLQAPPPQDRTFAVLSEYWLQHRAPEKRSRKDDESILRRHLNPAFGSELLRSIGVAEIDAFKQKKVQQLSPKTVANILILLGTMLRLAVELGWLAQTPPIKKPRVSPDAERDPPALKDKNEIERFLTAAEKLPGPKDARQRMPAILYRTAVYTGMRAGELAGLRWSDVNLEKKAIRVRRSYAGTTKTRASQRLVPIGKSLLTHLLKWRAICPKSAEGLVFPNRVGKMLEPCSRVFQETFHAALVKAGLEQDAAPRGPDSLHFHSLRHSFARYFRQQGGSLEHLIEILGHTSREMTLHYAGLGKYHRPEHFQLI